MEKFREWMQGRGRGIVMLIAAGIALCMVIDFYQGKNDYLSSKEPNPTVSPKSFQEEYLGGEQLAPVPSETSEPGTSTEPTATGIPSVSPSCAVRTEQTGNNAVNAVSSGIHLGFAGDICLDDNCAVMRHMKQKGGLDRVISPSLIKKMNGYDAMIINHEFSVSDRGKKMAGKAFTFRSKPSNLKYLKQLGVDVAGLANNHIYDYGKTAFLDTLDYLKKAGFQTMGAGRNSEEAKKPVYLKIKGKTIAIIAATRAEKYIMTPAAGKNSPGVFRTYHDAGYVKAIRKAKKKADYVIAYVHWGTEYSTTLENAQIKQAKDYINAGADVVVGAHTHCMQGIGYYKGVPIFYSLGNFWFNEKTLYTTVLEINIDRNGTLKAKMLPCLQRGKETRLLSNHSQRKKFVKYVNRISDSGKLDEKCNVIKP